MGRNPIEINPEELIQKLKEFGNQHQTAEYFGVTQPTISNKLREYGLALNIQAKTPKLKGHESIKFSFDETKEILLNLQKKSPKTIGYDKVDIEIDTPTKLLLVPLGDWHIGARYVYYDSLIEAIEIIKNNPNIMTILCGDYCDNYNTSSYKVGQLEQMIDLQEQKAHAESLIKEIASKTLGIVQGCHVEFSVFNDGFDFSRYVSKHLKGYYLGHYGIINLKIGVVDYSIYVKHKTWRNSTINLGHGSKSIIKENADVDIVISAHNHTPYIEECIIRGKKRYFVKCGPFKGEDNFSSRTGFPPTSHKTPGLLLDPLKKEVMLDSNYKNLIKYL